MTFDQQLFEAYAQFQQPGLDTRRVLPETLHDLVLEVVNPDMVEVQTIGHSIEKRPVQLVKLGAGSVNVLMWAQMHGNESTASRAIIDILKFFCAANDDFSVQKSAILEQLTIHIIPVLNPDGAVRFDRLNAVGIDLNRDAAKLQSPESRILKKMVDEIQPLFGFNLHDQNRSHAAGDSGNPATMTFLAPPFDHERSINDVRKRSMQLIGELSGLLNQYIPGHIGKWSDEFEPRAFGDLITKWGTSVVLFESGGYPGDREKALSRKLHFVIIIAALDSIANNRYEKAPLTQYEAIPFNESRMMDVIIRKVKYTYLGHEFVLDIGVNWQEKAGNDGFYLDGLVEELGDLSHITGYEEYDAEGLTLEMAKVYPETMKDSGSLHQLHLSSLHDDGVGWVRLEESPQKQPADYLLNILSKTIQPPNYLEVGMNPTFALRDAAGKLHHLFINGFEVNSTQEDESVQKGIVIS